MFGIPFIGGLLGGGGGLTGLLGIIPIYAIMFGINFVIQLVSGNLDGIFNPPATP
jgi:uncharacterized membrane protein